MIAIDLQVQQIETPQVVTATFLTALALVESSGDPRAVGDAGEIGIYQISKIYVRDVVRITGGPMFSYADRWDMKKSRMMTRIYLTYWGAHFIRQGYLVGPAELCAIHRFGPRWRPWREIKLDRDREVKLRRIMEDIADARRPMMPAGG